VFDFLKRSNGKAGGASGGARWAALLGSWRREAEEAVRSGDLAHAEGLYLRAIQEAKKSSAPRPEQVELHLDLAEVQRKKAAPELARNPGDVLKRREVLASAERTVRTAIELALAGANTDPHEFVLSMDALAAIFTDAEDFKAVETVEREALRLGAALPNPDIGLIADRTHRLAIALHRNGRAEEAANHLEKTIELHQKRFGENSAKLGDVLTDCGAIYRQQGNHERAKQCLERAFKIHAALKGSDSPETFDDVQQLARVMEESGDLDGAAHQYERALVMKMRRVGFDNLEEVAEMQYRLANLYIGWGNLSRARELLEEAVGEFRRHGGPRFAVAMELLAQVEEELGNFNIAVEDLEKAGQAWEKCGPAKVTELIRNLDYRADLLEQLRRIEDAAWLREKMALLQHGLAIQA